MSFSQAEIDRFKKSFVKVETGCWEWSGTMQSNGYGSFHMVRGKRKTFGAHRVSWSYHNNLEIPDGMCICHTCDNRKCVNPAHLYAGTSIDNNRDTVRRRRAKRATGLDCPWTKLSDDDVISIIESTDRQWQIAERYGIDQSTVSQIKSGKRRSNVSSLLACR